MENTTNGLTKRGKPRKYKVLGNTIKEDLPPAAELDVKRAARSSDELVGWLPGDILARRDQGKCCFFRLSGREIPEENRMIIPLNNLMRCANEAMAGNYLCRHHWKNKTFQVIKDDRGVEIKRYVHQTRLFNFICHYLVEHPVSNGTIFQADFILSESRFYRPSEGTRFSGRKLYPTWGVPADALDELWYLYDLEKMEEEEKQEQLAKQQAEQPVDQQTEQQAEELVEQQAEEQVEQQPNEPVEQNKRKAEDDLEEELEESPVRPRRSTRIKKRK